MRDTCDQAGSATRISFSGELSHATADHARDRILSAQRDGREVICDLAQVTFIDVSGMCVLLDLAARAGHGGGLLTITSPPLIFGTFLRLFGVYDGPSAGAPQRCNSLTRSRRERAAPAHRAARRARH